MKLWTTTGSRRVLHVKVGRWKMSFRRGSLGLCLTRDAPGALYGALGPVFFTALRSNVA